MNAFTDDTALVYHSFFKNSLLNMINDDLLMLTEWFTSHSLILSIKTKYMLFDLRDNNLPDSKVVYHSLNCASQQCDINCIEIQMVDEFKYLGVIIDNKLNFKSHIKKIKKEVCFSIRKFYHLKFLAPINILHNLYYSLVYSRLQYGISCWGGAYLNNIKPLYIAQKKVIRVINNKNRFCRSYPLFKQRGLLPLRYIYIFKVLKLFYRKSGNIETTPAHDYQLRSNIKVQVPFPKTERFRRYYLYTAPRFYNMLPDNLKILTSSKIFCRYLKDWLLNFDDVESLFDALH